MQIDPYTILWVFMIYALLGWCLEVIYATVKTGTFVNRGFLNGSYCPIYGCGVVIVTTLLDSLRGNIIFLFIGSAVFATILEFITGFLLKKIFHSRWWDYSNSHFNIGGYVCLWASLVWGGGGVILMKYVHPLISNFIALIPRTLGSLILGLFFVVFVVDLYITVLTVLKLNTYLRGIDELAYRIHSISDTMGENISDGTIIVKEKTTGLREDFGELKEGFTENLQDFRQEYEEKRKEYELALSQYKSMLGEKHRGYERLLMAFPNLKSELFDESLSQYKDYIKTYIIEKKNKNLK